MKDGDISNTELQVVVAVTAENFLYVPVRTKMGRVFRWLAATFNSVWCFQHGVVLSRTGLSVAGYAYRHAQLVVYATGRLSRVAVRLLGEVRSINLRIAGSPADTDRLARTRAVEVAALMQEFHDDNVRYFIDTAGIVYTPACDLPNRRAYTRIDEAFHLPSCATYPASTPTEVEVILRSIGVS